MKRSLSLAVMLCALAGVSAVSAQNWKPHKPVEIIVGTSPGGGQDLSARAVQRLLQEKNLVEVATHVVNKPGAGSALGYAYLNQHPGDAHFIMLSTTPLVTNPITGLQKITYEDLTPLALLFEEYIVASVAAGSPIKDAKELIARLKANASSVTIGIPGVGGGGHLAIALAAKAAGIDPGRLKTVVFKSGGDSVTALLGGHIDVMSSTTGAPVRQSRAGKIRILAIGAPHRLPGDLAPVPTWRESGVDAQFANWRGMVGPGGLSAPQVAYWEQVFAAVVDSPEFRSELEKNHWSSSFARSAEMRKRLKEEHDELKALLTELGMAKQ
jgi:putative tricarboxylic transport membrane protein